MFKLMPAIYEAEVEKAKAEVNFAEIEYKNSKSHPKTTWPADIARSERWRDESVSAELFLGADAAG